MHLSHLTIRFTQLLFVVTVCLNHLSAWCGSSDPLRTAFMGSRHAIVIGVNYPPPNELAYTANDAQKISDILRTFGFETALLIGPQETSRTQIMRHFDSLRQKIKPDDSIVVFFSGHGVRDPDNDQVGYLLPRDADRSYLLTSSILMSTIQDISRILKARHMLFIIDACFSGIIGGFQEMDIPEQAGADWVSSFLRSRARQVLTAGSSYETAIMYPDLQMSVFSFFLVQGLNKEDDGYYQADLNNDGLITIGELYEHIATKVIQYTEGKQHPRLFDYTADNGRFVFVPKEFKATQGRSRQAKIEKGPRDILPPQSSAEHGTQLIIKPRVLDSGFQEDVKYLEFRELTDSTLILLVGGSPVTVINIENGTIAMTEDMISVRRFSVLNNRKKLLVLDGIKLFSLECEPCRMIELNDIVGLGIDNELYTWDVAKKSFYQQPLSGGRVFLREARPKDGLFQISDTAISSKGGFMGAQSYQGTAKIWDTHTGSEILNHSTQEGRQSSFNQSTIAFSPNERYVAIMCDEKSKECQEIIVYDLVKKSKYGSFGAPGLIHYITFSPDSNYLLAMNRSLRQNRITLWGLADKEKVLNFERKTEEAFGKVNTFDTAAISPNNRYLALGSSTKREIELWRVGSKSIDFSYKVTFVDGSAITTTGTGEYIVPEVAKEYVYFVKGLDDFTFDEFASKYEKEASHVILNLKTPLKDINLVE